ncbi:MAG: hypothetical protein Q9217_003770 [Psora testacea]
MPTKIYTPTHYETLSLPNPWTSSLAPTTAEIKIAYKRALLLHHPDKSPLKSITATTTDLPTAKPTIDQIGTAYRTLISPSARAEYEKSILLGGRDNTNCIPGPSDSRLGLEMVDLDDMLYAECEGTYYRSCRCGRERAYVVREKELEQFGEEGEIRVGCKGCSLWIQVEFGVVEED